MGNYYDKDGKPIGLMEWCGLFENKDFKRIAYTELPDGSSVSTVWLGLDHRFSGDGPPLIFETMRFCGVDGEEQVRYSTLEEAKAGHEALVKKYS